MFHVPKTTHPKPNSTYGAKTKRGMIKLKADGMKFFFLFKIARKIAFKILFFQSSFRSILRGNI